MTNQQTTKPKKPFIQRHPKKLIFLLIFVLLNYPWFYFGNPIEGLVVDQSGQPIADVVVVFQFSVKGTKNLHQTESVTIKGLETLTDENGHYSFAWWVTKKRPIWAFFSEQNPIITFYKNGYKGKESIVNIQRSKGHWPLMYVRFKPNKKSAMLYKYLSVDEQKSAWFQHGGRGFVAWGSPHWADFDCGWTIFPLYFLEKHKVIKRLKSISLPDEYDLIGYSMLNSSERQRSCLSPKQFFKELKEIKQGVKYNEI